MRVSLSSSATGRRIVALVLALMASALLVVLPGQVRAAPAPSAAACSLPAQQTLQRARELMHSEEVEEFTFPAYPSLGVVTVEIFIRAREIWVNPGFAITMRPGPGGYPILDANGHPTLTARYGSAFEFPGIFLQGDGRDSSSDFSPEKTRAMAVMDFGTGRGYFIVNKSVNKLRLPVPGGFFTLHQSWAARDVYRQFGGANNWFYADWITGSNFRFRFHIKESAFGTSWVAPAIDAQITVNKDTGRAVVEGDTFPTIAVHQPTGCRTLVVRHEVDPADLYQREQPGDIHPGYPVNATPGRPSPPPNSPPDNQAPAAAFSYSRLPGRGNLVSVNGTPSRDPDGSIAKWTWFAGSRTLGTGRTAILSLGGATSTNVTLRVEDDRGATGDLTRTISTPNRGPRILGVSPGDGTTVGSITPTLAVVAEDDDRETLSYSYDVTGPSVDLHSGWVPGAWTVPERKLDPGTEYSLRTEVRDARGAVTSRSTRFRVMALPTASDVIPTSDGGGYWQVASDGGVFSYGNARFFGSLPGLGIRVTDVIGMSRTPDDGGYWLVGADGGVYAFGNAPFYGSMGGQPLNQPVVGMTPTPTGRGYWLVAADGGVFAFGDAAFYGSMGGQHLNAPMRAIVATPTGWGYWLAAADGGIFAYGDAAFYGSMGGQHLNAPVVDMDATPTGGGYWMTAEDGGVFAFGDARFFGSMAGRPLNGHITGMARTADGQGYYLNGCDGGIFAFGNAIFAGSNATYMCRGT